jgi:hypothetical protein
VTSLTEQQQLWDWLKAERRWQDKVRQWLRAEGVSKHVLIQRRKGHPEAPQRFNRAARRRWRFRRAF